LDEIAEKSGLTTETLSAWVDSGILIPEGYAEDSTPILSQNSLKTTKKISTLLSLGYNLEEIKKIIKKVGLPDENNKEKKQTSGKENYLTVGALADNIGLSTRTIKHWEEKGIIEPDLRTQGGFRLYRDYYVLFCNLIRDLQLFGYSLDEIKTISDYFRDFIVIKDSPEKFTASEIDSKLTMMEEEIKRLFDKTEQLKNGIKRWEDLLKKQKKQIVLSREKNKKREKDMQDDKS
jgi:DNA-binding transcriptional MerR regulator